MQIEEIKEIEEIMRGKRHIRNSLEELRIN